MSKMDTSLGVTVKTDVLSGQYDVIAGAVNTITGEQTTINQSIDALDAQYTVKVNTDGHITGFGLASGPPDDPAASEFMILADKFKVVNPNLATDHQQVFTVGEINGVGAVGIDGNLFLDGSLHANAIITDELTVGDGTGGTIAMGPLAKIQWMGVGSTVPSDGAVISGQPQDVSNLVVKGDFPDGTIGPWSSYATPELTVEAAGAGCPVAKQLILRTTDAYDTRPNMFPVAPGDVLSFEAWIDTTGTTKPCYFGVLTYNTVNGGPVENDAAIMVAPGMSCAKVSGTITITAGTLARPWIHMDSGFSAGSTARFSGLWIGRHQKGATVDAPGLMRNGYSTFIDGRKIYTGDAYVGTLQVAGESITATRFKAADISNINQSNYRNANIIDYTFTIPNPGDYLYHLSVSVWSTSGVVWTINGAIVQGAGVNMAFLTYLDETEWNWLGLNNPGKVSTGSMTKIMPSLSVGQHRIRVVFSDGHTWNPANLDFQMLDVTVAIFGGVR